MSGLGRDFMLMLPTLTRHPLVRLVAAADLNAAAYARFAADFGGRVYADFAGLCADPDIDLIYIAAPHKHHAEQAIVAAHAGRAVLVEKPMAMTLVECRAMAETAQATGTPLIIGPSHGFDAPVALQRRLVDGAYTAFLGFARGVAATLTFSGYAHFDSDALCDWVGETGHRRDPIDHGAARRRLQGPDAAAEAASRTGRGYAQAPRSESEPAAFHEHFGFVMVIVRSC